MAFMPGMNANEELLTGNAAWPCPTANDMLAGCDIRGLGQ